MYMNEIACSKNDVSMTINSWEMLYLQ